MAATREQMSWQAALDLALALCQTEEEWEKACKKLDAASSPEVVVTYTDEALLRVSEVAPDRKIWQDVTFLL